MNDLSTLAQHIDVMGLSSLESEVTQLVRRSRRYGAPTVIVDILEDQKQAEVARLRAFARLHAWYASSLNNSHDQLRLAV